MVAQEQAQTDTRDGGGSRDVWLDARACLGTGGLFSVVMPAYHLRAVIAANVERVHTLLDGRVPFELVVVDDGSGDGSDEAIRAVAARHPGTVVPVVMEENVGKGAALRRGFEASRGSHVMLLDGDLDLAPELIAGFFSVMRREQADIVIGSKRHPESEIDYPLRRRIASRVYSGIVRLLIGLPVTDTQTGMKLFRREAMQWVFDRMLVKRYAFDLEVLSIAHGRGYRVCEAPIRMNYGQKMGALTWANVKTVMTDTLAIFYRLRLIRYYQNVETAEMPDPPPRVSVVIACPAPSPYLDEALAGLAAQTLPPDEIIILPDVAPAGVLAAGAVPVRVVPTGRIRPAEKRNRGIELAQGAIVAFLDDDAYPAPNWLLQALRYFAHPAVAAVGGPALTPPGDSRAAQLGGRVYANILVSGSYLYRYISERVRKVDDLPSCNLLVRTDVLRELGGFNTRYWPGEDTILCSDIVHRLGRQIVYDPWTVVFHHRRPLFGPHLRQIGRYALHRGFFCRRFPQTSLRVGYMLPSALLLGIALGWVAALLHPVLAHLYIGTIFAYLILTLLAAFHRQPSTWLTTWAGIVATHLVYGARFLQGLCSGTMPCEKTAFDHPSEKVVAG
ncbi:MAG: glycosyltransferase [Lentisphaerae bacterium]|nr:glycosyltransferase [Lentisphaerota bacterium]